MEKRQALLIYRDAPPSVTGLRSDVYLASDVDARIAELEKAHARYEKVRRLNPQQFIALHMSNVDTGVSFDELVDRLPS